MEGGFLKGKNFPFDISMAILYGPKAFFIRTIVHFLFPAYAVITTEEHQMHDPFGRDPELIEENAFLNQGIKEQEPSEAESTKAREAPEPRYLPSGRGFLRSTTLPQPINI
jgi:hypothetical protein